MPIVGGSSTYSYAPMSAGFATDNGLGVPSMSVVGAPALFPALIAGEPAWRCRSVVLANKGSTFRLPAPAYTPTPCTIELLTAGEPLIPLLLPQRMQFFNAGVPDMLYSAPPGVPVFPEKEQFVMAEEPDWLNIPPPPEFAVFPMKIQLLRPGVEFRL